MLDANGCSVPQTAIQLALFPELGDIAVPLPPDPDLALPVVVARPKLREIAKQVAADHGIALRDLLSASRQHYACHPRQDLYWRARRVITHDGRFRYSLPFIGRWIGHMRAELNLSGGEVDHTTVLHGIRAHERRLRDERIRLAMEANAASAAVHGATQ